MKMRDMTDQDVFMNPFGTFFEVATSAISYTGNVEKGEKGKHFSYLNFLFIRTMMPPKLAKGVRIIEVAL